MTGAVVYKKWASWNEVRSSQKIHPCRLGIGQSLKHELTFNINTKFIKTLILNLVTCMTRNLCILQTLFKTKTVQVNLIGIFLIQQLVFRVNGFNWRRK